MADKEKKKLKESKKKSKKKDEKKQGLKQQLRIAYGNLEDPKKFYKTTLIPLVFMGVLVFCMPVILRIAVPIPLNFNPLTFIVGGIVPILLGIFYPFISCLKIRPVTGFITQRPDDNGGMVFIPLHHTFGPVQKSQLPIDLVGQSLIGMVAHTMGFNIGFIHNIKSVLIT